MVFNESLAYLAKQDLEVALEDVTRATADNNLSALAEAATVAYSAGYTLLMALGIPESQAAAVGFGSVEPLTDEFIFGFKRQNTEVEDVRDSDVSIL